MLLNTALYPGQKCYISPKNVFLLDAIGAVFSFVSITAIACFHQYFGVPRFVLHLVSLIAVLCAAWSLYWYNSPTHKWPLMLRAVATLNLLYCAITITFLVFYNASVTTIGWIYFAAEVIVICTIGIAELIYSNKKIAAS